MTSAWSREAARAHGEHGADPPPGRADDRNALLAKVDSCSMAAPHDSKVRQAEGAGISRHFRDLLRGTRGAAGRRQQGQIQQLILDICAGWEAKGHRWTTDARRWSRWRTSRSDVILMDLPDAGAGWAGCDLPDPRKIMRQARRALFIALTASAMPGIRGALPQGGHERLCHQAVSKTILQQPAAVGERAAAGQRCPRGQAAGSDGVLDLDDAPCARLEQDRRRCRSRSSCSSPNTRTICGTSAPALRRQQPEVACRHLKVSANILRLLPATAGQGAGGWLRAAGGAERI